MPERAVYVLILNNGQLRKFETFVAGIFSTKEKAIRSGIERQPLLTEDKRFHPFFEIQVWYINGGRWYKLDVEQLDNGGWYELSPKGYEVINTDKLA